jgi:hypothetical protein
LRLHEDAALWQKLRAGGYANTQRYFSVEAARATLLPWLGKVGSASLFRLELRANLNSYSDPIFLTSAARG